MIQMPKCELFNPRCEDLNCERCYYHLKALLVKLKDLRWTKTYQTGETSFERDWRDIQDIKAEHDKIMAEIFLSIKRDD